MVVPSVLSADDLDWYALALEPVKSWGKSMLTKTLCKVDDVNMKMIVLASLGILSWFSFSEQNEIYVAPEGKDSDAGSRRAPFATLEKARDVIREKRKGGDTKVWTVWLRPGRHERTAAFHLTAEDRNTIYRPHGSDVCITGGFRITGWKEEGEGVWSAEVPGLKEGRVYFEQLFVDDTRAVRARWPKTQTDWTFGEKRKDYLIPQSVKQVVITNSSNVVCVEQFIVAKPGDLDVLARIPKEDLRYAALVVHHNWDTTRRIILDFDAASHTVKMTGGLWKPWNPWRTNSLYYVENVRSAFTAPGEWFLAKQEGKVYYRPRPKEDMRSAVVQAPRNGVVQLVAMDGCVNLTFKEIQFGVSDTPRREKEMKHGGLVTLLGGDLLQPGPTQFEPCQAAGNTEALILADNVSGCAFLNCRIQNTGEYGLWLRGNCHSNRIERCQVADTGAGSLRLCDFPNKKNSTFNVIKNCSLLKGGRFHASSTAVWIGEGTDNTLTHNHIADHYYTGISVGWCWGYHGKSFRNEISYNLVENIGQASLGDMGGIYTLGTQTGTRIFNNLFRNIDSFTYGGWGIYPDEGSEGLLIENNLVYNVKDGGFHQHYGKENTVRNNIFAFSRKDQIAATRAEQHLSVRFTGNIIYWDKPRDAFERYSTEKVTIVWDKNIWFCEAGEPLFRGKTFAQWQAAGKDKEGLVCDPLFVNPQARDFRFRSDKAYKKIGFTPFDFTKAGVEK
jgi:parallel beta-helix repeat protein